MKHIVTFLLAVVCALAVQAGEPRIEWIKTVHDFGAFKEADGQVTAVFTYRNVGDEPLVVIGSRANCGCTTPRFADAPLAPGDTAQLVVSYDPAGRPGQFTKKVYVDTNTEPRRSTLTLKGVVVGAPSSIAARYPVEVGPMRITHSSVLFGSINRGRAKSVFENAYNASTDTLRPVVLDTPKWLEVKAIPEVAHPGEQISFNFFIKSSLIPEWGMVTDTVTVRPDASSDVCLRLPVVVTVTEDFSSLNDKERIDAPIVRVKPTRHEPVEIDNEAVTTHFELRNDGKNTLKIRRIYTRTPGVTIEYDRDKNIKKGRTAKVSVTVPPELLGSSEATTIVLSIITNDPTTPRLSYSIPVAKSTAPNL